jgi:hypothetical protein
MRLSFKTYWDWFLSYLSSYGSEAFFSPAFAAVLISPLKKVLSREYPSGFS